VGPVSGSKYDTCVWVFHLGQTEAVSLSDCCVGFRFQRRRHYHVTTTKLLYMYIIKACGIAIGWTMLQVGRLWVKFPMRLWDFSVVLILPAALWPWGWLSLWQKWVPGIFLGEKGGLCIRMTTSVLPVSRLSTKMCEPQHIRTQWASTACYRVRFTLLLYVHHQNKDLCKLKFR
jgi:hypothetical protein